MKCCEDTGPARGNGALRRILRWMPLVLVLAAATLAMIAG